MLFRSRVGDTPDILEQKKLNRMIVANNMKAESGKAYGKSPSVQNVRKNISVPETMGTSNFAENNSGLLNMVEKGGKGLLGAVKGLYDQLGGNTSVDATQGANQPGATVRYKGKLYLVGADGDTLTEINGKGSRGVK